MDEKLIRIREIQRDIAGCRNNDLLLNLMEEQINIFLDKSFVWDAEGIRAAENALAQLPALQKMNDKFLESRFARGMSIQNKYQRIKAKVKEYDRLFGKAKA